MLYHDRKGGNLLTPSRLAFIQRLEQRFTTSDFYPDICHKVPSVPGDASSQRKCSRPSSIVQPSAVAAAGLAVDPTSSLFVPKQVDPTASQADIDVTLQEYAVNSTLGAMVPVNQPDPAQWTAEQRTHVLALASRGLLFGRDFGSCDASLTTCDLSAAYMRSYFPMGLPLDGYDNENDQLEKQEADFDLAIAPFRDYVISELDDANVEVIIFGTRILQHAFDTVVQTDLLWAGGSIAFVVVYLCVHTTSPFLGLTGMLQILLSLPLALFFYRLVLQVSFFQTLHSLAIFIILGIGADNIFVFVDAFMQAPTPSPDAYLKAAGITAFTTASEQLTEEDAKTVRAAKYAHLTDRIAYTYRRAVRATAVTSGTTAAAFLATGVSEIMPIATFGYFAASLVVVAWLLNLSFLPPLVTFWHMNVRWVEEAVWAHTFGMCCKPRSGAAMPKDSSAHTAAGGTASPLPGHETEGELPDVSNPMRQGVAKTATVAPHGEAGADEFSVDRAMELFFRDQWAPLIFKGRYAIVVVFMGILIAGVALGAQLQPLSEQEQFLPDTHYTGRGLKWTDERFGLTAQDRTVEVTITWGVSGIDRDGTDVYDPLDKGTPIFDSTFDPSSTQAQQDLLNTCDQARNVSSYTDEQSCWVRSFAEWLQLNSETFPFTAPSGQSQQAAFVAKVQAFCGTPIGAPFCAAGRIGIVDGAFKTCEVKFKLSLKLNQPYAINKPVYDAWQAFVDRRNRESAPGVSNAIQTGGSAWQWMITERAMVRNALVGMAISVSVALVVLILSTHNFVVGGLATLTIVGIVATIMATMYLQGWELGITQSISSVILIGFSVDYVVHYANSYIESEDDKPEDLPPRNRYERTRIALAQMGVSILAGAITTFGAGVFLFGAIVLFFTQMGIVLLATISYALIWSTVFFPAALMTCGPEGDFGNLSHIYASCRRCAGCPLPEAEQKPGSKEASAGATAPEEDSKAGPPSPDAAEKQA